MRKNNFTLMCVSWLMVASFLIATRVNAEIICRGENQVNTLQLSSVCTGILSESNILDDNNDCPAPYIFLVLTQNGDTLGTETINDPVTDFMEIELSAYIGDTLIVKAIAPNGSQNNPGPQECEALYEIVNNNPPVITNCPFDTIYCSESLDTADILPVTVVGACNQPVTISFVDSLDENGFDCNVTPPLYGTIFRTITATAPNNQFDDCIQEIAVLLTPPDSIMFPPDITLDCTSSADTSITGRPTLRNRTFENNDPLCDIDLFFSDDTTSLCGGSKLIEREWRVIFDCQSLILDSVQNIFLLDDTPPVITCPPAFSVNTDDKMCTADVTVPAPTINDDCSNFDFFISIPNETGSGFDFLEVDTGMHDIKYLVIDSCNNVDSCFTKLTVIDNETPTAVCRTPIEVSLTSSGNATIFPNSIDDGSNDNCPQPLTLTISRDGEPFSNSVMFDCDDAGTTVIVTLQVAETNNPLSVNTCPSSVTISDIAMPVVNCPDDETIDCSTDISDLTALFGDAMVIEACDFTLVEDSTISLNNCNEGMITRTFTATDASNNVGSCTQTIELVNLTPFDGQGIIFPPDYVAAAACTEPGDLLPGNLPPGFNEPIPPNGEPCTMFATSYSDQLFYIDFPACYKIVRTWKVMDWCQYDPMVPDVGIWSEQQVIAVMDNDPPVINFCPNDTTFSLNNDCTFAPVNLFAVTAMGTCQNEDVTITNDSPHAFSNGADASGNYPEGVHNITFTATDGCGNEATCSTIITVSDLKKPTAYCKNGIIGELQFMPNASPEIMAVVNADQLNLNSFDNCTSPANLVFTMRLEGDPDDPVPFIVFDCDGKGEHDVEIWVTDEAGNQDFCVTKVIIQDNMLLCNDDDLQAGNAMIGGSITNQMGTDLPDAHVEISNSSLEEMTDNAGGFTFPDLELGENYLVEPWKTDNPMNGITTFDMVIMSRHVLNILPLDSPYKIIAADINNSGSVTTADIVQLRKMILQIYTDFPNNDSWRFVDADYVFPNPNNPFNPPYPEAINVLNLSQDIFDANFVAVKIGDLNMSATVNFGASGGDDRSVDPIYLTTEDRTIAEGEEFVVSFQAEKDIDLLALQFTLEFETDLELQGIEKGALSGAAGDRFETSLLHEGIITGAWYQTQPVLVAQEDALFSLRFRSRKSGKLSEMISMTSRFTEAVAYDASEMESDLNLLFKNAEDMQTIHAFQLHQNQPNPFKKVTNIGFTLPESGAAELIIYDIAGNVLRSYNQQFMRGYNEISIQRNELPTGGVLYYQLQTNKHTATKKMILLQ